MRNPTGVEEIRRFMEELGRKCPEIVDVYLTGGATAVLMGWRSATIDTDFRPVPDSDAILRLIPDLKERLSINVEMACPSDFIPELPGWRERSILIEQYGRVAFYHYDLYSQALSKIERGHQQDMKDVDEMIRRGLVKPDRLSGLFKQIEKNLYKYPAIDPATFRRAVASVIRAHSRRT